MISRFLIKIFKPPGCAEWLLDPQEGQQACNSLHEQ